MTSVMRIILEWLAETSTARFAVRRLGPRRLLFALALALVMAASASAQQIGRQRSSTLELPPMPGKQQETLPQVSPVPGAPVQNVLVIPRASRDFVGEWGGHLRVTRVLGDVPASSDSIVSLAF